MGGTVEPAFADFVRARQAALVRLGWALTGDRQLGEDVAQATLDRLWPRWEKLSASGEPWAYAQRVAVSVAASWRRRRSFSERASAVPPDRPATGDDPELRADVATWLSQLPVRQRAVVVLRFLFDLSVDDVAAVLDIAPGTVKSQTAKALTRLRATALEELS